MGTRRASQTAAKTTDTFEKADAFLNLTIVGKNGTEYHLPKGIAIYADGTAVEKRLMELLKEGLAAQLKAGNTDNSVQLNLTVKVSLRSAVSAVTEVDF